MGYNKYDSEFTYSDTIFFNNSLTYKCHHILKVVQEPQKTWVQLTYL